MKLDSKYFFQDLHELAQIYTNLQKLAATCKNLHRLALTSDDFEKLKITNKLLLMNFCYICINFYCIPLLISPFLKQESFILKQD